MRPDQYQRLKPLFEQALDTPLEQRAAFVLKIRAADEELGRELESLIDAHDAESDGARPASGDTTRSMQPLVRFDDVFHAHPPSFEPNEMLLDRFRIVRLIGRGGMGEVYEAEDRELGLIAIKTIRTDLTGKPQMLARFRQEVQLARRIANPGVCRIHELFPLPAGEGRGAAALLTMERLEGITLAERIERDGALPFAEAESIALQLCAALQAIHNAGVIHRDIKSRNVMLVPRNGATHAVVMDLGLARGFAAEPEDEEGLTVSGAVMGTPQYMAPEQFEGARATPATDLYALGVLLYEMVTGKHPFQGSTPMAAAVGRAKRPPSPSSVRQKLPRRWDTVINRCLEYEPEKRYQSANEVAEALQGRKPHFPKEFTVRKRAVAAIGIVALVPMIIFGVARYRDSSSLLKSMKQQRIAVLPFEDIGGSDESRAFRDGLMETLSSQLTQLGQAQTSLSIVPASDVRKEHVTSAREAQRAFGANLAITGSVQQSGDGLHLTVNIVDASRLQQIGSREIFIPHSDAIAMQRGVVTQTASLLHINIRPEMQSELAGAGTPVTDAYSFYLQGAGYLSSGGKLNVEPAIAAFSRALQLDSRYALAHAGLGHAYWTKYEMTKDPVWVRKALDECDHALQLDPRLPAAHLTRAISDYGTGQYSAAIDESRETIRLDPTNDAAYSELARALDAAGRSQEAEKTLVQAIGLRPDYWNNYLRLGTFYFRHARYKEAEQAYLQVVKLLPENPAGYTNAGVIYHLEGRDAEAEQILRKSIAVRPTPEAYSNLATVYFFEGQYAKAVPVMEKLVEGGTRDYMLWGNLADAYRWAPGEASKAPAAYRKAIAFARQALAVNPHDAQALSSIALYLAKSGEEPAALAESKKALQEASRDKTVAFNTAIVYELSHQREDALRSLKNAIRGGYSISEVNAEPELSGLRADPRYAALISEDAGTKFK